MNQIKQKIVIQRNPMSSKEQIDNIEESLITPAFTFNDYNKLKQSTKDSYMPSLDMNTERSFKTDREMFLKSTFHLK
jgi:hypothetical protein